MYMYTPPPKPRKPRPESAFSSSEKKVMNLITDAHNEFVKLSSTHPDEMREWVDGIHALQNVLGWRVLRRDYPNDFYTEK